MGVVVLTMGEEEAMALNRDGSFYRARTEPAPEIDPLGSGNARTAGQITG
ncbi:MAG TPA: hypothetical protein VFL17_01955 [Anaerolineae bacterium]|nr:hypothetical protein [Anaerolineae bacterium]